MTEEARSDRMTRLLIGRLDALVRVADQLPHAETERLVELATVATMRAIALELIGTERAETIWRDAQSRNPKVAPLELERSTRIAA